MSETKSPYNALQDALEAFAKKVLKQAADQAAAENAKLEERLAEAEADIAGLKRRLAEKSEE